MSHELERLIEAARKAQLTDSDKEEQRRSFAYGNAHIENARITRQMVDAQAEKLPARS